MANMVMRPSSPLRHANMSFHFPLPQPRSFCNKTQLVVCSLGEGQNSGTKLSRRGLMERLVPVILLPLGQQAMNRCAQAEQKPQGLGEDEVEIIRQELKKVLKRSKAAGILRLVFHDAGTFNMINNTGGMNGSIIYELNRPENSGLDRPIKILETVKDSLSSSLPVSWADLIAVAGAESVALCGGPEIRVKLGRMDAITPDPEGELPSESLDATSLKKIFSTKGFATSELVVLSGAHTLGNKGFGNPLAFNNSYYKILLQKPWTQIDNEMGSMTGLPSDRALADDEECLRWVSYYANDQAKFFEDFRLAYLKLVNSGAKWRTGMV